MGVLGDVLLNGTAVGHEEKLCNRPVYRFKSAEDTSEGHLQDSVSVLMEPKQDLLEPQAIDAEVIREWTTTKLQKHKIVSQQHSTPGMTVASSRI